MANVTLDEKTLYYQWLINNNSTSTMLNALSGSDGGSSFNSYLSQAAGIGSLGQSVAGTGTADAVSGIGSLSGTDGTSSFARILQAYLNGENTSASSIYGLSGSTSQMTEAASMAEKLSDVLKEASATEDTNSLTYKTVQEIYEYFSEQVSSRAKELLGNTVSIDQTEGSSLKDSVSAGGIESDIETMNQAAIRGEEFDFSVVDELVDNSFGETTPLS